MRPEPGDFVYVDVPGYPDLQLIVRLVEWNEAAQVATVQQLRGGRLGDPELFPLDRVHWPADQERGKREMADFMPWLREQAAKDSA